MTKGNYIFKLLVLIGIGYVISKYGFTRFLVGISVLVTLGTLLGNNHDLSPIGVCLFFLTILYSFKLYRKNKWENYMKDIVGKEQFENNKDYYYKLKNK